MTSPGQVAGTAKDEAASVAGTAKDEAAGVASTAAAAAGDVAGTAKQEVGNVVGTASEQAKQLGGTVKEQAQQQVQQGSQKATEALRGLGKQLEEGDTSGLVGTVLSEASKRVQAFADQLEELGPQGLLEQAASYARRNPGTFLLGMAAAGFVTGRLTQGMTAGSTGSDPLALPAGPSATGYSDLGAASYSASTGGTGLTGYGTGTDYGTGYGTTGGTTTTTGAGAGYASGGYATGNEPSHDPTGHREGAPYATGAGTYGAGAPDLAGTPYPETDLSPLPDGTTTRGTR